MAESSEIESQSKHFALEVVFLRCLLHWRNLTFLTLFLPPGWQPEAHPLSTSVQCSSGNTSGSVFLWEQLEVEAHAKTER